MHRAHKGYTPEQWRTAAGGASTSVGARATGFDSFAQAKAAAPAAQAIPGPQAGAGAAAGPVVSPALLQLQERFARSKESFAKGLGVLTARAVEHYLKLGKRLEKADEETLREGWGAALDCLDIKPQFGRREIALKSPLWGFLFPILAVLLIAAQQFDLTALIEKWEREAKPDSGGDRSQGQRQNSPERPAPKPI